jgi:hypothetical protein
VSTRLLLERARTGALPDRLPDWGDVCIDPFSRKPLRYVRHPRGFTLYSVGRDRTDDGGVRRDEVKSGQGQHYDMVVEFELPPRRN